jgi:fatty-acyl-CoA synthase
MINLSSILASHARNRPDHPALAFDGTTLDYASVYESVKRLGTVLRTRGVAPGDVVGLLMKNSTAYIQLAFAISHVGAVILPINYRLSTDEIAFILEDAGARLLFVDAELAATAPHDIPVIALDADARRDAGILATGLQPAEALVRQPQDVMRLMYTSGTTSRPKGVIHSYENFYWKSIDHLTALELNSRTRLLVCGPLYHVGAFDLPGIAVLWAGGMMFIQREFEPAAVLEAIQNARLTAAWLAPVMTSALLAFDQRDGYDLGSLEWVVAGGERTPEARVIEFSKVFTQARYVDAYGLTESCSGDTLMPAGYELTKIGSVGRALMHVEVSIRDDDGMALPAGEQGEICLRGPKVTCGYWNDPDKTRLSFHDGWFRTGDVGYLDDDGFLFVTDRKKDMIISGGENIASLEVERVVSQIDAVREVAVIGLADPRWGEKPVAVVVLNPGADLDLDDVSAYCRSRLAAYKVPKDLFVVSSLPRNPSGKVLKAQLREKLTQ